MALSWKGSISFGLIYIPVALHAAARESSVSFNQLHRDTHQRIRYKKTCEDCGEVKSDDIVKGYEYETGKYVVFENSDFEKLKTERNKSIVIEQFTELESIDPVYYERSFYVVPSGAEKAFALLKRAMSEEKKVGIAKVVLGEKESLIALRASDNDMLLSTLFFQDEIKKSPAPDLNIQPDEKELKLAKAIINGMNEPFEPSKYRDEYKERLLQAIQSKIEGKEISVPEEKVHKTIDLMDALQASLSGLKGKSARATH